MMTLQQKLDFVHKQTKLALAHVQHFDSGGTALGGPVSATQGNPIPATAGPNGTLTVNQSQNPNNPGSNGIAGALGNVLGTNNNFQASSANITPGTNVNQLNQAYTGAQGALNQAGNLTNTLTPGVNQGASTQNTLTQQLQAEALGQGPNPAQNALNQNTGQNIAQAAALAASTRGAGANPGLIAQNAANQAATTQQQAVGQEATQQAQQQLNAQNALQNLASTQVQQGTNAVQLGNQTQQNEQNILQGANTAANNAAVSSQENINNVNAAVAAGNQNANQNVLSGIGSAINSLGSAAAMFAQGGTIPKHLKGMLEIYHPHLAEGGIAWQNSTPVMSSIDPGAAVNLPAYTGPALGAGFDKSKSKSSSSKMEPGTAASGVGNTYGLGGQEMSDQLGQNSLGVGPAPLTSASLQQPVLGSQFGGPSAGPSLGIGSLAEGGNVKDHLKKGGKVPGKPKVNHNDYANDTVSAKLSPGEVVIDLNTLKDKGKLGHMARFVAQNIERRKMGRAV